MEFLAKYDFGIKYIKGQENKVADALSRCKHLMAMTKGHFDLLDQIKEMQSNDPYCLKIGKKMEKLDPSIKDFGVKDGFLCFKDRIVILEIGDFRKTILKEAHRSPYFAHPSGEKMRENLKKTFYWNGMKRDFNEFVARCLECQKVKAKHQHLGGQLYPLDIPT